MIWHANRRPRSAPAGPPLSSAGTLAFFQVTSSREADRRLALAGFGAWRVALSRIAASVALGLIVSVVAYLTLLLRSGVEHPPHAAAAIFFFALIYIGIGTLIGTLVRDPLSGSLLVVLVFAVDAFTTPEMTSNGKPGSDAEPRRRKFADRCRRRPGLAGFRLDRRRRLWLSSGSPSR